MDFKVKKETLEQLINRPAVQETVINYLTTYITSNIQERITR